APMSSTYIHVAKRKAKSPASSLLTTPKPAPTLICRRPTTSFQGDLYEETYFPVICSSPGLPHTLGTRRPHPRTHTQHLGAQRSRIRLRRRPIHEVRHNDHPHRHRKVAEVDRRRRRRRWQNLEDLMERPPGRNPETHRRNGRSQSELQDRRRLLALGDGRRLLVRFHAGHVTRQEEGDDHSRGEDEGRQNLQPDPGLRPHKVAQHNLRTRKAPWH